MTGVVSSCLDCSPGCACTSAARGASEVTHASCPHEACVMCRRCGCCCIHAPGTELSFTLPLCFAGGDLARADDFLGAVLQRFGLLGHLDAGGRPDLSGLDGRPDTVPWLVQQAAMYGLKCRPGRDYRGHNVLVVRDVQGGVGDKILLGQALWGLRGDGAKLFGLMVHPEPHPVSLEVERLFWPPFEPLDARDWIGVGAMRRLREFGRVVAALSMPCHMAARHRSFAAACWTHLGVHPVSTPPCAAARVAAAELQLGGGSYVVLHVGARTHRYADRQAALCALRGAARNGQTVVVVGRADAGDGGAIAGAVTAGSPPVVDLRTPPGGARRTLKDDCSLVAGAALVVAPDSAVAHVAGVLGKRVFVQVDPGLAWLGGLGMQPGWWVGHYASAVIATPSVGGI